MILVCAAGLHGSNADDVGKEVAIYRAHKAAPIVIADDGEARFRAARSRRSRCRSCTPIVSFVLCAMAGHLFGYEAALAIDASARPLREARGCIEALVSRDARRRRPRCAALAVRARAAAPTASSTACARRRYDGALEAGTAVRLASLLRYATGVVPLDVYQVEFGKVGTPSTVVEDLTAALTKAIEELTRPIDAIKHQAKTVTVGISRSDETLLQVPLVQEVLATGAPATASRTARLRTLVALDPAVDAVVGLDPLPHRRRPEPAGATIDVVDRGGIARDIPSRTADEPDAARYQAPRRERARGHGGARSRRRPHADRSSPR